MIGTNEMRMRHLIKQHMQEHEIATRKIRDIHNMSGKTRLTSSMWVDFRVGSLTPSTLSFTID